jgi:amino acid transporter
MGGLRRQLGFWESMALSVGLMGPTSSMALNGSLAASQAGPSTALVFLGAAVTASIVAYSFVQFTRRYSHAGSVYRFNGIAFGPRFGFVSAWALLYAYTLFAVASPPLVGLFIQTFLAQLGIDIHWAIPALVTAAIIWLFVHRELRISMRTTLIVEAVSVGLILVLAVTILGKGGAHGLTGAPFGLNGNAPSTIAFAAIYAFLSFVGLESAATLGEEAHGPKRSIPLAIGAAVLLPALFYVAVIYTQAIGFGSDADGVKAFATSSSPLLDLSSRYAFSALGTVIVLGAAISTLVGGLSAATAASRLLFALARDGFGPSGLAEVHASHSSPWVAAAVVMVIVFVIDIAFAISGQGVVNAFAWPATAGLLSLLLVYLTVQVSAIKHFWELRAWRTVEYLIPVLGIFLVGYAISANVYPVPPAPFSYFPYAVLAWVVIGVVLILALPKLAGGVAASFKRDEEESARVAAPPSTQPAR